MRRIETRLRKCPVKRGDKYFDDDFVRTAYVKKIANGEGVFRNSRADKNLCMAEGYCHENVEEIAKIDAQMETKNVCVFYGFGFVPKDSEWVEHSWIVDKRGRFFETWSSQTKAYLGVPDYRHTPKSNHAVCDAVYKKLRKSDKTKGCTR